jgi:hypothetical protein
MSCGFIILIRISGRILILLISLIGNPISFTIVRDAINVIHVNKKQITWVNEKMNNQKFVLYVMNASLAKQWTKRTKSYLFTTKSTLN